MRFVLLFTTLAMESSAAAVTPPTTGMSPLTAKERKFLATISKDYPDIQVPHLVDRESDPGHVSWAVPLDPDLPKHIGDSYSFDAGGGGDCLRHSFFHGTALHGSGVYCTVSALEAPIVTHTNFGCGVFACVSTVSVNGKEVYSKTTTIR